MPASWIEPTGRVSCVRGSYVGRSPRRPRRRKAAQAAASACCARPPSAGSGKGKAACKHKASAVSNRILQQSSLAQHWARDKQKNSTAAEALCGRKRKTIALCLRLGGHLCEHSESCVLLLRARVRRAPTYLLTSLAGRPCTGGPGRRRDARPDAHAGFPDEAKRGSSMLLMQGLRATSSRSCLRVKEWASVSVT